MVFEGETAVSYLGQVCNEEVMFAQCCSAILGSWFYEAFNAT